MRLLGLLPDLEHAPALLARQRTRFGDANQIAHAAFVLLVVNLEAGALLDRLAVQAVRLRGTHLDDDGLVHLDRDHGTQTDLAPAARCVCRLRGGVGQSASSFFFMPRLGLGASSSARGSWTATAVASGKASSGWTPKSRSASHRLTRPRSG